MSERPWCDICNQPVRGDHYYLINGDVICPDCMEEYFRKELEEE
jgi:hypothetical protein